MKNALPLGRALVLYSHAAEAYYNTDSVVYYDSTFSLGKQENAKSARIFSFIELGDYRVMADNRGDSVFLWEADGRNSVGNFLAYFCSKSSLQKMPGRGEGRPPLFFVYSGSNIELLSLQKRLA